MHASNWMGRLGSASLTLLGFLALASGVCGATPTQDGALDALFSSVNHSDTPGCAVAADLPSGPIRRTYGVTNLEQMAPITQQTIFEAGSVSKQFTAASIAVLVARHALSLDDNVRKYVPELPDYGTTITVRELLEHTSGLRNWDDLVELQGWPRGTRVSTQVGILQLLSRQRSLNFKPGTEFSYSNSNYVVAAIVAARASGQPFQTFSRDALFAPLGMAHTRWRNDFTEVVPGRAPAFTPDDAGTWHLDMPFEDLVGPGGLLTTTGDLLRWNAVLARPSAEQRSWVDLLQREGRLADGTATGYALGLELDSIAGVPAYSHAGATAGYRAYLAFVPSQGVSIALLCNAGNLNTEELGPKLTALFVQPEATPTPPAGSPDDGLAANVAGAYRIVETGAPVNVNSEAGSISFGGPKLIYVGNRTFESAGATRIATVVDSGGRVERITVRRRGNSQLVLERVRAWHPSPIELRSFEGAYFSSELNVRYMAVVRGGSLQLEGPNLTIIRLAPAYRNVFTDADGNWTVSFSRDRSGRATHLTFTGTRSRFISFSLDEHSGRHVN